MFPIIEVSKVNHFSFRMILLLIFKSMVGYVGGKESDSWPSTTSTTHGNVLSIDLDATEKYLKSENFTQQLDCVESLLVEDEYMLFENGSLLSLTDEHLYNNESYFLQNNTAFVCPIVIQEAENSTKNYNFSKEFLSCGHILIKPHEFKLMKNGSLYIDIYSKLYNTSNFYLQEHGVYVCLPKYDEMQGNATNITSTQVPKFSKAFTYVSLVGVSISIISLMLHIAVFCLVSKVRNLPGCCLASLSLSLLLAYLCFVSSSAVATTEQCADLGAAVYYFFLTSFFWMNAIAFDVWRSFRAVMRELRISSHRVPWRRFLLYSVYSWLTPAILVCVARLADSTDFMPKDYRPSFGTPICWFGQRKALLVFFASPLCFVMALNALFFLDSSHVINVATMKSSQSQEAVLKRRFFMFMRLALIMGLTWIVGIIAGYVDQEALWYIFVVLNTLQGLFIFIVFSCSSKVRGFWFGKMRGTFKSRQGTSVRTISQMSGAL